MQSEMIGEIHKIKVGLSGRQIKWLSALGQVLPNRICKEMTEKWE
jgi:hypothetical protein